MLDKPFYYVTDPTIVYYIREECFKAGVIGVDVETTRRRDLPPDLTWNEEIFKPGLDPWLSEIRLLQIALPDKIFVIDCWYCAETVPILGDVMASEDILKIGHNFKFDMKQMMRQWGFHFRRIFDTMLASQVISNGIVAHIRKHNLHEVALRYLRINLDKSEQKSDWGAPVLSEEQIMYSARDVDVLYDLFRALCKFMLNDRLNLNLVRTVKIENDCSIAVARMELDGVYVDPDIWNDIDAEVRAQYLDSAAKLKILLGKPDINLDSPAQVKKALADKGIKVDSTNEKLIAPLAEKEPIIAALLECRGLAKLLSSYGNGIPGKKRKKGQIFFIERVHPLTGRIHADFYQLGAETGRFACEKPNVEQVPSVEKGKHRVAFNGQPMGPYRNAFIVADYSQFEMRILAELSQDENLMKAFTMGDCIHTATAALMFDVPIETIQYKDPITKKKVKGPNYWMRGAAKSINFGLVYGRGARSLAAQIGVTPEKAKELIQKYFQTYPHIKDWLNKAAKFAAYNGFTTTPVGRVRYFEYDHTNHMEVAGTEREGKNTPIQGCNADVTKIAMFKVHCATEHLMGIVFMANVIHDELNLEAPPDIADEICQLVKDKMEEAAREVIKTVPVIAEAAWGSDWTIK